MGARRIAVPMMALFAVMVLGCDLVALSGAVGGTASGHGVGRRPVVEQSLPLAVIGPPGLAADPPTPATEPPTPPISQKVVVDPAQAWAVLIGVQHYDSPTHPTFGALGDVAAFHQVLIKAGWPESHIMTLTDQQATTAAIRRATSWLVDHSRDTGFSLFHYSGHVEQAGGHEYLWGVDNGLIPNDEFASTITAIKGRAWIDVAGCESAGFDDGVSSPLRFYSSSSLVTQKSYEQPAWAESVWTAFSVDRGLLRGDAGPTPSVQASVRWAQRQAEIYTSLQRPYGPQVPYAVGGDGEWYLGPAVAPP